MVSLNIAIYGDDTAIYSNYNQASDLRQQLELTSELDLSEVELTSDLLLIWGRRTLLKSSLGKLNLFYLVVLWY